MHHNGPRFRRPQVQRVLGIGVAVAMLLATSCAPPIRQVRDRPVVAARSAVLSSKSLARQRGMITAQSVVYQAIVLQRVRAMVGGGCFGFDGLRGPVLREEIERQISDQYVLTYREARDHMYGLIKPYIDVFGGQIEGTYTGRMTAPDGTRTPGGMNTEHSWPQSRGSKHGAAHNDIHHLFIVDGVVNSTRQNYWYGHARCGAPGHAACLWVGPAHKDEAPSKIGRNKWGQRVFEVRSSMRGDIARAQFYFSVRYHKHIPNVSEAVLRRWSHQDPPDLHEKLRNRRIERVQGNRNVFVDCPEISDRIRDF